MVWMLNYLGQLPGDNTSVPQAISADGTIVYGYSENVDTDHVQKPCKWTLSPTALGVLTVGESEPVVCCTSDGASGYGGSDTRAISWASSGAASDAGLPVGYASGNAWDTTDDGVLQAGYGFIGPTAQGILWGSGSPQTLVPVSGTKSFTFAIAHAKSPARSVGYSQAVVGDTTAKATMWNGAIPSALQELNSAQQSQAVSISADGSVIVGRAGAGDGVLYHAASWNGATGFVTDLGIIPGGAEAQALYVTPDGATVIGVGFLADDVSGRVLFWQSNALTVLDPLPGGTTASISQVVVGPSRLCSDNGVFVIGNSDDGANTWPVVWIGGVPQKLPYPTGGLPDNALPYMISRDGSRIFGSAVTPAGYTVAVMWTNVSPARPNPFVYGYWRADQNAQGVR